jgi:hypothetical protein
VIRAALTPLVRSNSAMAYGLSGRVESSLISASTSGSPADLRIEPPEASPRADGGAGGGRGRLKA